MQLEADSIVDGIAFVVVVILLYRATFDWVVSGFSKKAMLMYIASIVFIFGNGILPIIQQRYTSHLISRLESAASYSDEKVLKKVKDCNKTAEYEKVMMGHRFAKTGVLETYKDSQGRIILFSPSQQDIDLLLAKEKIKFSMSMWQKQNRFSMEVWFVVVMFAILFGWLTGRAEKHQRLLEN